MSNGHACCVLSVCCPPGSPEQHEALVAELVNADVKPDEAEKAARYILQNFDLAPHGSLDQFKADVARMARETPGRGRP